MQQMTYKDVVLQILVAIDYQNDKEKYATEFEMLNRLDAMAAVVEKLPQELQQKVKECKDSTELEQYINRHEYEAAYAQVSQRALEAFITSLKPSLSVKQKEKITNILTSLI